MHYYNYCYTISQIYQYCANNREEHNDICVCKKSKITFLGIFLKCGSKSYNKDTHLSKTTVSSYCF